MPDQENRDLLTGMLLDLLEEYDQVLVFTTVGDIPPESPGIDGVKLFWAEGRGCIGRRVADARRRVLTQTL